MDFLYFIIGTLLGLCLMWLYGQQRWGKALTASEIAERYVVRELYEQLTKQYEGLKIESNRQAQEARKLDAILSAKNQQFFDLQERFHQQKDEMQERQKQLQVQFEQLANAILEEKSQRFAQQNSEQIGAIVSPLKDKLFEFEQRMARLSHQDLTERISLKKEIEQLRDLNQQLSEDAIYLANALKGESKVQGDWGEMQLEVLLQKAGLEEGQHYRKQFSLRTDLGAIQRPDFVILLPDNKQVILDSKVSLVAYEQYFRASTTEEQKRFQKAHIDSLRRHIRDLSGKNYHLLQSLQSPDFVLLFVPIEEAYRMAIAGDSGLLMEAIERNVAVVTTSTLLTTLRTIGFIWRQERQKQNVLEIAKEAGKLYDKFCAFVEDLQTLGKELDQAQRAYHAAFNKLSNSPRFGDTIIGRAERIRQLGASASKILPSDLRNEDEMRQGELPL